MHPSVYDPDPDLTALRAHTIMQSRRKNRVLTVRGYLMLCFIAVTIGAYFGAGYLLYDYLASEIWVYQNLR